MQKFVNSVLIVSPLLLLISIGWFFNPKTTTPVFIIASIVVVTATVLLCAYLFSVKDRNYLLDTLQKIKKHPLLICCVVWLCVQLLSMCFAYDRSFAFYGSALRFNGIVTSTLFFVLLFEILLLFTEKWWRYLFSSIVLSTTVIIIGEYVDVVRGLERPESFLGNPIFIAQVLLFGFWAAYLLLQKVELTKRRVMIFTIGLIFLISILLTKSRGVILAVTVSGVLTTLVWFLFVVIKKDSTQRRRIYKRMIGILSGIILLFTIAQFATRGEIWAHIPGVDRLVAVAQTDNTVLSRLSIYKTSLGLMTSGEASVPRLLFGWGNDNYQFAWATHYNPEVYTYDKTVFDRSHNILLDALVMNGFLGLSVFLVLLFFIYKFIFSLIGKSVELFLLSLFVFTAYILQAMTAPDGIITSYYFFIFVAYLLHKIIPYENK